MHSAAQASSAFGWVSIACWVLVYTPQIVENYELKSGEGLSVLFVAIWLAGDIFNLLGAVLARLIPTVIILAVYYTLCDVILLLQIYYYRLYTKRVPLHNADSSSSTIVASDIVQPSSTPPVHTEQTPLLGQPAKPTVAGADQDSGSHFYLSPWLYRTLQYIAGIAFVTFAGLAAWWITGKKAAGDDGDGDSTPDEVFDLTSQLLGWASAILYIGSRIPQIIKNRETKCEGLSLALFLFTIMGNVTYVLSICVISMEKNHLILSGPWLAGSIITIFLDFFVMGQFFYYRSEEGPLHLADTTVVPVESPDRP